MHAKKEEVVRLKPEDSKTYAAGAGLATAATIYAFLPAWVANPLVGVVAAGAYFTARSPSQAETRTGAASLAIKSIPAAALSGVVAMASPLLAGIGNTAMLTATAANAQDSAVGTAKSTAVSQVADIFNRAHANLLTFDLLYKGVLSLSMERFVK